jgi:LysM repeat protein
MPPLQQYRVQRGDTLTKIAQRFGFSSWKTIYFHADNAGYRRFRPNPDKIYVGDVIQIPPGATPPGPIPRDPTIRTITDAPVPGPGHEACCHLAVSDQECPYVGAKRNFKCPPGYYKSSWVCTEGTRTIYCAECAPGGVSETKVREAEKKKAEYGNCWDGPFACSIWYYL